MTKSKEVTIDARWLHTGLGTYTFNLIKRLSESSEAPAIRAIIRNCDRERIAPFCKRIQIVDAPIYTLREQFEVPFAARDTDLLHVPHYNIPLLWRGKVLITVHDIIHLTNMTYRRNAKSWIYSWPMLKAATRKACHVITVSEHSKTQLIRRVGVPREKITVIYHGVSSDFDPSNQAGACSEVSATLGIGSRFLLYVGNLKPHKNLGLLLKAFSQLCTRKVRDMQLLIVGDDSQWKMPLVKECRDLGLNGRVIFVSKVRYELLLRIYAAAELLVMPSLEEGFGFPVLEAMASGTPVVCARASALPEVAGDAVEYFDPYRVDNLVDAIARVFDSPSLQASLRHKGLDRARRFTWDECIKRHLEIYQKALES
jgi:glycosyltransferase involved in cell wall biosynthesis